jgi:hypothetical protein
MDVGSGGAAAGSTDFVRESGDGEAVSSDFEDALPPSPASMPVRELFPSTPASALSSTTLALGVPLGRLRRSA